MSSQQNGRTISFVRHALPEVDPMSPPSEWPLTSAGVRSAKALKLPRTARLLSSPEIKALQTVALATGSDVDSIVLDPAFREIERIEAVHDGYRAARAAWVSGALDNQHQGWESPKSATNRICEALLRYEAPHLVIGTHGMVLTAWLVSTGAIEPHASAVAFWEQLPFPAVATVEMLGEQRAILRPEAHGVLKAHATGHSTRSDIAPRAKRQEKI